MPWLTETKLLGMLFITLAGAAPFQRDAHLMQPVKEEMFVPIGGIDQWITIKGDDSQQPGPSLPARRTRRRLESVR